MTIGDVFNGRIGNLQKKGMPLGIEWNQGKLQLDYWVIPKGAPNPGNAQKFIEFATRAKRQAAFSELIPYGPTNMAAFDSIKPETAKQLPTFPANLKKQFHRNEDWYAEVRARPQVQVGLAIGKFVKEPFDEEARKNMFGQRAKEMVGRSDALTPHGEEARSAVSNHEATDGPASFETRASARSSG